MMLGGNSTVNVATELVTELTLLDTTTRYPPASPATTAVMVRFAAGGAADTAAIRQVGPVEHPPVPERRRATGTDGESGI